MPYHLPDESSIGSCTMLIDIPTDPKWATIITGAISELGYAYIWEEGTGTLTVDEARDVVLAILDTVRFQAC